MGFSNLNIDLENTNISSVLPERGTDLVPFVIQGQNTSSDTDRYPDRQCEESKGPGSGHNDHVLSNKSALQNSLSILTPQARGPKIDFFDNPTCEAVVHLLCQ